MKNHPAKNLSIGVDLGGTKIHIGLIDCEGNILNSIRLATDTSHDPTKIEHQILQSIEQFDPGLRQICGVGVGIAGQVDNQGNVSFAPNLKWKNVTFGKSLQNRLGVPIKVINDVRAATYAEWQKGIGRGCSDLICLFIGTGIGGGIVSAGKLLQGSTGCFGEVGHMIIDWNGPPCTCGAFGCFESIAGGWAIALQAAENAKKFPDRWTSFLSHFEGNIDNITAKEVIQAGMKGDLACKSILEKVENALIAGCVSLANIYNPEYIIFGGGIVEGAPYLIKVGEKGIQQFALPAARKEIKIQQAKLGNLAGMIGAGLLAFDRS